VVASTSVDIYFKSVSLNFSLGVLKNGVNLIVQNELNLITSIEFFSGQSPLSRDERPLLDAAVTQDSSLGASITHKLMIIVITHYLS
jgi:hypothetical protein